MYYLNKIVGFALSPLGVGFIGALFIWLFYRTHHRKLARTLAWALAVFLWIISMGLTTRYLGAPLEYNVEQSSFIPKYCSDFRGLPQADAICLLGGGIGFHEKCHTPELFSAGDRVLHAARLYRAGLAPKIICTSKHTSLSTAPILAELGVKPADIICLEEPRNTEEESKAIHTLGVKRILLVTSAWHMKRSKSLFESVGFEIIEAPTDYEMSMVAEAEIRLGDFFPSADALARNSYALKEWIARFGYWAIGK